MSDSQEGRKLHLQAEVARESGKLLKALEYTDQAIIAYTKDGDLLGLAEVLSSRQSTFKHLYRQTNDKVFLILEKYCALASVEVAKKSRIKEALAIPYHNLGKYYFEAKEYQKAAQAFKMAVENLIVYPKNRHSRPSVISDIKGHQYAAEYHLGDKTALERAEKVLEELEQVDEASYNKNAWLSGAHLRIAEMTAKSDMQLAKKHLKKAEEIIKQDKRQILRSKQLIALKKALKKLPSA